jgi:chemotaxis family two-component system response regulator Rcp1
MPSNNLIRLLLVEDNLADIRLIQETLNDREYNYDLTVARNGEEALQILHKQASFAESVTPNLIILDLNIPRVSGHELLAIIKEDQQLRRIPVIVMSSSLSDEDIRKSYELQANCYIPKPLEYDRYVLIVQAIESFWFGLVRLPEEL